MFMFLLKLIVDINKFIIIFSAVSIKERSQRCVMSCIPICFLFDTNNKYFCKTVGKAVQLVSVYMPMLTSLSWYLPFMSFKTLAQI